MDDLASVSKHRLTVVVVLYNIELSKSDSLTSIKSQLPHSLDVNLVLWDNSPVSVSGLEYYSSIQPFKYFHSPENLSLAKLYNRVVESESFDYILILDQDTKLPENYFKLLEDVTASNPGINLFLPIVKNGTRIVSPGHFQYFKGTHLKMIEAGVCSSKNMLAVASGMVIARDVFSKFRIRFDERLNFYGIDSRFMLDYARHQQSLLVMPVTLNHNSAMWSDPSADELLPRFRNLRKAWSILLSDKPLVRLFNSIYYTAKSVMFTIKFRDSRFLK